MWSAASMEPSSAEDGDHPALPQLRQVLPASMEPSSAEDGDSLNVHRPYCQPIGFNGAVLSRGRRRHRQRLAGLGARNASMEPSSAEDGDCRAAGPVPSLSGGFNGAVLSRGRRQVQAAGRLMGQEALQWSRPQQRTETLLMGRPKIMPDSASMEPSSAEDGDGQRQNVYCSPDLRFNGAVLSRGRRPAEMAKLWCEAADASMEPSSAEDGDDDQTACVPILQRLQWSRPQQRTETPNSSLNCQRHASFNGAVLSRGRRQANP